MIKAASGIGAAGMGITLREEFFPPDNKILVIHYGFRIRQQALDVLLFAQHSSSRLLRKYELRDPKEV
jgi:hypothetical protein